MIQLGNSSIRGQRLFAGTKTDASPFTLVGTPPTSVTYNGNSGALDRDMDVNSTIAINVPGDKVFPSSFTALIALRDNLNAGNNAAVGSGDIAAIDRALDDLLGVRSEVGAKVNRIESARDRQTLVQMRVQELLSKAEDTDYAETLSRFASEEAIYKAALETGSKAIQPSLLDFLR